MPARPRVADPAEIRLAIVVRDLSKYSETFVRRHIEHLFGGRTLVIATRGTAEDTDARPALICGSAPWGKNTVPPWRPGRLLRERRQRRDQRQRILGFLEETGATHVLCEFGYVAVEVAHALRPAGLPTFCYFRGIDASALLKNPNYVARLREIVPDLAGIFAVSRFLLDNLARAGVTHPRAEVVPSGTDVTAFRPLAVEPKTLLTVGRLVPKKSPAPVIRALALLDDHRDARLEVVGEGPELDACIRLASDLGVRDRVDFLGQRSHDFVIDRMGRATAYVQHFDVSPWGDTEGMPNVIQEAMASGRAIVTTRHAGIPEHVVDGVTGLLAEPGDPPALAEGMRRVLADPALRDRLGRDARAYAVEHLDYRKLYRRVEAAITAAPLRR